MASSIVFVNINGLTVMIFVSNLKEHSVATALTYCVNIDFNQLSSNYRLSCKDLSWDEVVNNAVCSGLSSSMSLIQDSSGGVMINSSLIKTSKALYTVKSRMFVSVVVRILGKLAVVGLHLGMIN